MMRWFTKALLILLSLSPVSANAQDTGSLIRKAPAQIPSGGALDPADRGRLAMYRYAECVFGRSRKSVEAYINTFPGSKEAHSVANRLADDDCLSSGEMSFNEQLFRGSVYDLLYKSRFKKGGPSDFAEVAPIDYTAGNADEDSGVDTKIALREVADCTVRKSPPTARQLVLSMVATRAETDAFNQMVPHMSACVTKDVTLKFSKSVFRGVVGEVLYRLSVAAVPSASLAKDR
jgi:hypothetical protein